MFCLLLFTLDNIMYFLRTGEREKEKDSTVLGQSNGGGEQQAFID